jgi:hypothetical protein
MMLLHLLQNLILLPQWHALAFTLYITTPENSKKLRTTLSETPKFPILISISKQHNAPSPFPTTHKHTQTHTHIQTSPLSLCDKRNLENSNEDSKHERLTLAFLHHLEKLFDASSTGLCRDVCTRTRVQTNTVQQPAAFYTSSLIARAHKLAQTDTEIEERQNR